MTNSDKSYLIYMAARLLEMKRILKDTGSVSTCIVTTTMSHYSEISYGRCIWEGNTFATRLLGANEPQDDNDSTQFMGKFMTLQQDTIL